MISFFNFQIKTINSAQFLEPISPIAHGHTWHSSRHFCRRFYFRGKLESKLQTVGVEIAETWRGAGTGDPCHGNLSVKRSKSFPGKRRKIINTRISSPTLGAGNDAGKF